MVVGSEEDALPMSAMESREWRDNFTSMTVHALNCWYLYGYSNLSTPTLSASRFNASISACTYGMPVFNRSSCVICSISPG